MPTTDTLRVLRLFSFVALPIVSVPCLADEMTCAERIAQGSAAVVHVDPAVTVQIDLPARTHTEADDRRIFYKGGETRLPMKFPTTAGIFYVCAVLVQPGTDPDFHVVLKQLNDGN